MKNYYSILEIDRNSGEEEVKKAYRAMALRHHPDRNPDNPGATEKFKEITEAYGVLMDPRKRREYDEYLSFYDARSEYGEPRFNYTEEDIFRDLFNNPDLYNFFNELSREFGKSGVRFGPSFFENVFFRQGGIFVAGAIFSSFSPLSKAYKLYNFFKMAQTAHSAYRKYKDTTAGYPYPEVKEEEPQKKETLKEKIKGLLGKKDVSSEGGSVSFRLRITPKEAADGAEKPMAFKIDGFDEKITVKVPPGTQSGARLRLRGKGAKIDGEANRGDLYLCIEVE